MSRPLRIYLAGPIQKDCWRHALVPDLRTYGSDPDEVAAPNLPWPTLSRAVLGQFDYVGPYFISDDHGCGHQPGQHGMANTACIGLAPEIDRTWVVSRCLQAVGQADVLFAWLERPDCHGSCVEIGAALAIGVGVAVAYPYLGNPAVEAWFPGAAASLQDRNRILSGRFSSATAAFEDLVVRRADWFARSRPERLRFVF